MEQDYFKGGNNYKKINCMDIYHMYWVFYYGMWKRANY